MNIDFKEVKSKNGKTLVFCKLEDLIKDFYQVNDIEAAESNIKSNGEYIIHCPFCKEEGHKKHKLYIKSDLSVGHCFVCCRDYVNVPDEDSEVFEFKVNVPTISSFLGASNTVNLVRLSDPNWTLDMYKYEFDSYDETGVNYLLGRHQFMGELYKLLEFKFWNGNVVMPFKYRGEIFYYQIRFSNPNSKIRYFFPPISAKPPYIIEVGNCKKIIICEGIYDAISLLFQAKDFTPVAVLGSSISDYQMSFIREYAPEEILVYMDDTEKSKKIADRVKSVIDYCPVNIIKSDGTDPEENMIKRMNRGEDLFWIESRLNNNTYSNDRYIYRPNFW